MGFIYQIIPNYKGKIATNWKLNTVPVLRCPIPRKFPECFFLASERSGFDHQNAVDSISTEWYSVPWHPGPSISGWQRWSNCIQLSHLELPFGYWTVRHGKLHYLKGKSPTNMYNGVIVRGYGYVKLPDGIYPTLSDFVKTPNSNLTSSTYIYICQKNHCWISE